MKKIIFFLFLLGIFCFVIVFSLFHRSDKVAVTTIPKAYSLVSSVEEDDYIEIFLYVSEKKSFLSKPEAIKSAYIADSDEVNVIKLKTEAIEDRKEVKKIKNRTFHLFSFLFSVPVKAETELDFAVDDAELKLVYSHVTVNLKIGSFFLAKIPFYGSKDNQLSVCRLKPILADLNGNKTLGAIAIGFRNNTDDDLEITDIKLQENNVFIAGADVIRSPEGEDHESGMNAVFGPDYDLKAVSTTSMSPLKVTDTAEYIFPLKYAGDYAINSLGFTVEYRETGSDPIYRLYYDDFIFFSGGETAPDESGMIINVYEND